jgi:hypothetical protein
MANELDEGQRMIATIENAICTQELLITCKLASGMDITAEEEKVIDLYRTLQVSHHFWKP